VRMALGALPLQVQLSVLARTMRLALVGIVIGAVASFAVSQVIAALLFQTEPTDLMTFLSAAILLLIVALLAGYMPALRATQVDPMTALRSE
jgi:ABC-type antimicrobial peptide transport system permease subunit